jgi:hypothetical protein
MDPRFSSPYPPNHGSMGCYQAAIEESFLKNGYATCPEDGELLRIRPFQGAGAITRLMATCRRCDRHSEWEREQKQHRKWTKAESASMTSRLVINGPGSACCPIDGCGAQVRLIAPGTPFAQPLCPGCGNAGRGV